MQVYPKTVTLRYGTRVDLRPLQTDDHMRLVRFFLRVPEADRYYLKEDVTDSGVIGEWTANINFARVVPMVAVLGEEIVADATLHQTRNPARRHVGELRIVVDPAYRGRGLATSLLEELLEIAAELGRDKTVFEAVEKQEDPAVRVAKRMGFTEVATLEARVIDLWGHHQNLVILERPTASAVNGRPRAEAATGSTGPSVQGPMAEEQPAGAPFGPESHGEEDQPIRHGEQSSERAGTSLGAGEEADDEVYEGSVIMRLETHGNAQQTMHFLNELGSNMQIRLLQMAGGGLRQTTLWLALRMPLRLRQLFLAMNSVSEIRKLPKPMLRAPEHVFLVVLKSSAGEPG